ncbi:hypothetical protein [Cuniculiplasma thermophilum]|uniref:hypothetical protein n=1 Tax=Cuniculiplasma sp. SKW3 TaxID=3400170 RepID=UPI003FD07441
MISKKLAISIFLAMIVVGISLAVSPMQVQSESTGAKIPVAINDVSKLQNITAPPASLPVITYYYGTSGQHYTITSTDWTTILSNVFDNRTIITYGFANNTTQALILLDITYTGLNPYGVEYIGALSHVGILNKTNEIKAFWMTANQSSQIPGLTNWQALNEGAYPGFSWSKPQVVPYSVSDEYAVILIVIAASVFVMYFVFNRRK